MGLRFIGQQLSRSAPVYASAQQNKGAVAEEGAAGVENYKDLLRAGGSDYPYELLREAGVDLATPGPYQSVVARMNAIMDEMEMLLDQ